MNGRHYHADFPVGNVVAEDGFGCTQFVGVAEYLSDKTGLLFGYKLVKGELTLGNIVC